MSGWSVSVNQSERNLLYFAWEYFFGNEKPGQSGHWDSFELEDVADAPQFHKEICDEMNRISYVKRNGKVAAAPRSHAKSTYLSKANPLHEIVYRLRKYIIVISETPDSFQREPRMDREPAKA
ncbi:hypothetical protein P7H15_25410 [Paenibacillus larvae]|nr:hypothetical protein [Paenibacillus larvae]MDT2295473.1 hypothetical protein [Paenibacillus larvae]